MKDIETCKKAGKKISNEIYINLFGNLIINGLVFIAEFLNKIIF